MGNDRRARRKMRTQSFIHFLTGIRFARMIFSNPLIQNKHLLFKNGSMSITGRSSGSGFLLVLPSRFFQDSGWLFILDNNHKTNETVTAAQPRGIFTRTSLFSPVFVESF